MEEGAEIGKVADDMTAETGGGKEESPLLKSDANAGMKEHSHSHLKSPGLLNKYEFPHSQDDQKPVGNLTLLEDDTGQPRVVSPVSPNKDLSAADQSLIAPPGDCGGEGKGDADSNVGNNEKLLDSCGDVDGTVVASMEELENDTKKEEVNDGVDGASLGKQTRKDQMNDVEMGRDQLRVALDAGQETTTTESGTEEELDAFMKELETFHKERCLEFKPPKFYGEPLNCLKLWRSVIRLGGYEQVTSCKLWRQVGESFRPPKTCTTVSWTFRCFYEKALLEYEKYKMRIGELPFTDASFPESSIAGAGNQVGLNQSAGSGRARRDAAARAMQGWHSQRLLGNSEVGDPIIKNKNQSPIPKREKQFKSIGLLKRKKPSPVERAVRAEHMRASELQLDNMAVDVGPPADWVKINVQRTNDCFEVYALVPGLLREEVRVQSDPAGRLVISGQPEQPDNPWGVTPFKKVVSLPSRIDPHQTSAVVTLHGQLFVRVPFEHSDL